MERSKRICPLLSILIEHPWGGRLLNKALQKGILSVKGKIENLFVEKFIGVCLPEEFAFFC